MANTGLSKLVVSPKQPGHIYEEDTHRLLRSVITDVTPLHFVAIDEDGRLAVFDREGNGCQATGHGNKRFEAGK